ncbi:MAG: ABC transporter substrate-binding protein [Anaerolineales bacterium]
MRKIIWQLVIALGGLLLVLGLLLGQTPDPEATFVQPVHGGSYAEGVIGTSIRLNPLLDRGNQVDRDINRLLYGALVRFNSFGDPIPELAESFAVSADATLYNFTIREGARWHDGESITADDVIFTFSKFVEEDFPASDDLKQIWSEVDVVKLDDKNIQFQLPERFAPFMDYMTVGLLPDHLLRGVGAVELIDHPFNAEPVGSGPFRFEGFQRDDTGAVTGVSLTAFEEYVLGQPFLERVEFRFFEDAEDAFRAFRDGKVDGIGQVPEDILNSVLAQPDLNVHSVRSPSTAIVFLNTQHSDKTYLGEKEFRQALMMAVDRERMIGDLLGGQGLVASGPILPGNWAYAPNLAPLPFDVATAEELLAGQGWEIPAGISRGTAEYIRTDGDSELTIQLAHLDDPHYLAVAQMLKASWENIGIRVELAAQPAPDLISELLAPREYEAVLTELDSSQVADPDPYSFWHDSQAETGQNYSGFEDRNISIWLEQARVTPDKDRRQELYRDFQFRFRDQTPALFLYHPIFNYAISVDVQGASVGPVTDPSDRFANIKDWFLLVRRGFTSAEET